MRGGGLATGFAACGGDFCEASFAAEGAFVAGLPERFARVFALFFFGMGSFGHEVITEKRALELFAVERAEASARQRLARTRRPRGLEAA